MTYHQKKPVNFQKRIFATGIIGNLLETYDLVICAFMSQIIALTFFSTDSGIKGILNTFYILLVGYLSRPIGSIIIGLFADQIGRKKMLIISVLLIGVSTAMIGIIPSYEIIGIYSAILFLCLRILQNIFAGGEYISSIAYLIESGEEKQQGYYGCWSAVGVNSGALIASFVVFIISSLINMKAIPDWSWRIAFLLSLFGTIFGLWLRYSIPESIEFILKNSLTKNRNKLDTLKSSFDYIKSHYSQCLAIFGITWLGVCVTFSIYVYSPIHMSTINHLSHQEAFSINTIALLLVISFIPLFGFLSDRINKIYLLGCASLAFALLAFPYFWYISYGNYVQVMFFHALSAIPSACYFGIAPVLIAEIFPVEVRCTAVALMYQTFSSIAAGLTPLILLQLVHKTSIPYSPAYLIILSTLLGSTSLFLIKKPFLGRTELQLVKNDN